MPDWVEIALEVSNRFNFESWFNTMAELSVEAAALILAAAGIAWMLRNQGAAARGMIWTLALLAIPLLPLPELLLGRTPVVRMPEMSTLVRMITEPTTTAEKPATTPKAVGESAASSGNVGAVSGALGSPTMRTADPAKLVITTAFLIWAAGLIITARRRMSAILAVRRLIMSSPPVSDDRLLRLIARCSREAGLNEPAACRLSTEVPVPVCAGVLRPIIILPEEAHAWSDRLLSNVITHELAHVRRQDNLVKAAAVWITAFFWFNPAVHWAARRLELESEHQCDDDVLMRGARATDYADHLVGFAHRLALCSHIAEAGTALLRSSMLRKRLKHILTSSPGNTGGSRIGAYLASAAAIVLVTAFSTAFSMRSEHSGETGGVFSAPGNLDELHSLLDSTTADHEQGNLTAAAAKLESLNRRFPYSFVVNWRRGLVLADQGRYRQALEPLQRALALRPDFKHAMMMLGISYYRSGDRKRAMHWLYRGFEAGFIPGDFVRSSEHFAPLRTDTRVADLVTAADDRRLAGRRSACVNPGYDAEIGLENFPAGEWGSLMDEIARRAGQSNDPAEKQDALQWLIFNGSDASWDQVEMIIARDRNGAARRAILPLLAAIPLRRAGEIIERFGDGA